MAVLKIIPSGFLYTVVHHETAKALYRLLLTSKQPLRMVDRVSACKRAHCMPGYSEKTSFLGNWGTTLPALNPVTGNQRIHEADE